MAERESAECPFCGESEFDLIGLKLHLVSGWCTEFADLDIGYRLNLFGASLVRGGRGPAQDGEVERG